jgi:formyl-CoA transferase/succinyl-CoA--D-citramalate CoA-transferase
MSGFRHLSGEPGRPPVRVGVSIGDSMAGTQAFIGALLALWRRDRPGSNGAGQVVDVALYEAMWMHMESLAAEYQALGRQREPSGGTLPGIAPSNAYPTRDDGWLLIGANHDSVFIRLAEVMGRPDWLASGSSYADHVSRGQHQAELDGEIADWTSRHALPYLLELLSGAGIPHGTVYTAADIVEDPHYQAREMLLQVAEPNLDGERVLHPGVVPKLSTSPGRVLRGAPLLGEHNAEVLGALASGFIE